MKDGGNAFPLVWNGGRVDNGMTLRQWYKGMALRDIVIFEVDYIGNLDKMTSMAVACAAKIADAMIAEDEAHGKEKT